MLEVLQETVGPCSGWILIVSPHLHNRCTASSSSSTVVIVVVLVVVVVVTR